MTTPTEAEWAKARTIVREWSESEGRGLALSVVIANALATARVEALESAADDESLIRVAHGALQDQLVALRNSRISVLNRGNGLVIREKDGKDSYMIRMATDDAVRFALRAIAAHLKEQKR